MEKMQNSSCSSSSSSSSKKNAQEESTGGESRKKGIDLLRDPSCNKGLAFTGAERDKHLIRGLLPHAIQPLDTQLTLVLRRLDALPDDLERYRLLRRLQSIDTRLFFTLLQRHISTVMPYVYTPTVGLASQRYSELWTDAIAGTGRELWITIDDLDKVDRVLRNIANDSIRALVVTDGERILGLGDLGANGMAIPVGKMALYTAIGGIDPRRTLPAMIDVGTNNQTLLDDPAYIGIRRRRTRGESYDRLIDQFMRAVVRRWGRECLVQFEDFGNRNASRLADRYRSHYCSFNDDIQGTAAVIVAAAISANKIIGSGAKLREHRFLFYGAGEAALGAADLLSMAIASEDNSSAAERPEDCISLIDSRGLITANRICAAATAADCDSIDRIAIAHKSLYARKYLPQLRDLLEIIDLVRPTMLIGVSGQPQAFTAAVIRRMAAINRRPVIFALSNPTSKAECTAEQAYTMTEGKVIFASGSPFGPVHYAGVTHFPTQCNNVYIYPAIASAVINLHVCQVPNEAFLEAAARLAELVGDRELARGLLFPPLDCTIRETVLRVATAVGKWFYARKLATLQPEPQDMYAFLKSKAYDPVGG